MFGRNKNNKPAEEIASDLIATGVKARNKGVQNVYVSSILPIADNDAYDRALDINGYLRDLCFSHDFTFISNSFLTLDDLKDPVHLNENGRVRLVNNYIDYFNM